MTKQYDSVLVSNFMIRMNIAAAGIAVCCLLLSCKDRPEKTTTTEQPKQLVKNAAFDFSKLTFKEDVALLLSESLDTTDTGFDGTNREAFLYGKDIDWANPATNDRLFKFPEKRYVFHTLHADSMARYQDCYFDHISIEADAANRMSAIIGEAELPDQKSLDSLLLALYNKYGKTTDMQAYDKTEADYKSYLLDNGPEGTIEWLLDDRFIQLSFSPGTEMTMSTNTEDQGIRSYINVTLLFMKRAEYDQMAKTQLEQAKLKKKVLIPAKAYSLHALDPQNQSHYNHVAAQWDK